MLGDEELVPTAQAATLEILHSTVMKDPDGPTFEARLRVLASASAADGKALGAASQVAQVLLDAGERCGVVVDVDTHGRVSDQIPHRGLDLLTLALRRAAE